MNDIVLIIIIIILLIHINTEHTVIILKFQM